MFRPILWFSLLGTSHSATVDYITAFQTLQNAVGPSLVWPTPNSNAVNISSTFGPRRKVSCSGCYDFHRGIDIHGETGHDVVAIYNGYVARKLSYADGGDTLVIEHTPFADNVTLAPGKASTRRWFSLYMHLSARYVNESQLITAGQIIGAVGMTGSGATSPHLHFEVRVGTRCSLEWSLANPDATDSTCNPQEYDPHVHPFLVFPNMPATKVNTSITQNLTALTDAIVHIQTPDTSPNLNKYLVQVINNTTSSVRISHLLDLNLRIGFNATSTAALDTQDKTVPYLEPVEFGYTADIWQMDLIIPTSWVTLSSDEHIIVTLTDVWGVDVLPQIIIKGIPMSPAPTPSPTPLPTPLPTKAPTPSPTKAPTPSPTKAPTPRPTKAPTPSPTKAPTQCGATNSPCTTAANCCSLQCQQSKRCK